MSTTTRLVTTAASPLSDWGKDGLCRQVETEIFFPEGVGGAVTAAVQKAKKVCGSCPVRQECLAWAVRTGQRYGVWGGLSQDERRELAREADVEVQRIQVVYQGRGYKQHPYWPEYPTAAEGIVGKRLREVQALVDRRAAVGEMAVALNTNAQTVKKVLELLASSPKAVTV